MAAGGVAASLVARQMNVPGTDTISLLLLWLGMATAIAHAFWKGRPARLLDFRALDLLWGLTLGVGLRLLQGVATNANRTTFPNGQLASNEGVSAQGAFTVGVAGVGGPIIEEFFFRAIVLVAVYELLRRSVGGPAAALTAALSSAGLFVLLHAIFGPLTLSDGLLFAGLGLSCASLVLITGRIWGAVIAHATYNLAFLAISGAGALLS